MISTTIINIKLGKLNTGYIMEIYLVMGEVLNENFLRFYNRIAEYRNLEKI